jgi:GxxExxY protein
MNSPQRHGDTETNDLNDLTHAIIGAAIAVHRVLGPGLLESIYETALCVELDDLGIKYVRQYRVPAYYKGRMLGNHFVDLIVDDRVVVEVKSVAVVHPVMEAQLITYMRLTNMRAGLLINFNSPVVVDGITRRVL